MTSEERIKLGYLKQLTYNKDYDSFSEFYDENKPEIYKAIISVFEEFKVSKRKILAISLSAKITGVLWETDFSFTRDQYFVLKRDILPFFEENEDYETCHQIMDLDKQLDKQLVN